MRPSARLLACAMVPLLALGSAAGAQTPQPSPSPLPTPLAFSAHAHANATVVAQSNTFSGTVQLGLAQRANLTRIDVLSVKSDSFPVPPLSLTVVIDRGTNTVTGWSDGTKLYHVQPFLPRPAAGATPRPRPSASAGQPRSGSSPFAKLEVFELTMKLIGHSLTLGLPTTGLRFDMQVQNKGDKAVSRVTATTQLADEFAAFPMTVDVAVEPGAAPFSAKLAYAVDDVTRGLPPLTRFTVPAGYAEAPSFLGLIFPGRRATTAPGQ